MKILEKVAILSFIGASFSPYAAQAAGMPGIVPINPAALPQLNVAAPLQLPGVPANPNPPLNILPPANPNPPQPMESDG